MVPKKIFVVISGRDSTSKGIYYDWQDCKDHVQGVKKSTGIRVLWKSFDGVNREDAAREYWHEHHSTPPTIHRSAPVSASQGSSSSTTRSSSRDWDRDRDRHRSTSREISSSTRGRSARKSNSPSDKPRGRSTRGQHNNDFSRDNRNPSRDEFFRDNRNPSRESSSTRESPRSRHSSRTQDEFSGRSRTRDTSRTRDSSRTRTPSWEDSRQSSSSLVPEPFNTVANRYPGDRQNPNPLLYQHWQENSTASAHTFAEPGSHWAEQYLQLRLRRLEHLRRQLPSPPGRKPADNSSSIVTERWCDDSSIPIPTDIVDREFKLATETYRKILYTESWTTKEQYIVEYIESVDGQHDFTLQHMSDVIYQSVHRQTTLLQKNKADVEQLVVSQSIQKQLFEQNQRLRLVNKALKQHNLKSNKKVQFDPAPDTTTVPDSPLKKTKTNSSKAKVTKPPSVDKSLTKSGSVDKLGLKLSKSVSVTKKTQGSPKATPTKTKSKALTKSPSCKRKSALIKRTSSNQDQDLLVNSASDDEEIAGNSGDDDDEFGVEYSGDKDLEDLECDIDLSRDLEGEAPDFSDSDSESEHRDSFGFDQNHPDCPDCVSGSGRKQGHVGRHTRIVKGSPAF